MPTSLAFDIDLDPIKVDKLTGVCQGKERLDWLRKKYPANAEELGKLNEEVSSALCSKKFKRVFQNSKAPRLLQVTRQSS